MNTPEGPGEEYDRYQDYMKKEPYQHDLPRSAEWDAADDFLRKCGLDPTPDAIGQLMEAFLPALEIMTTRGYDPEGRTWRAEGWRGMLWKIRDKTGRMWFRSWKNGHFDGDSAIDNINYCGFYYRLAGQEPEWGERGAPGHE